MNIAAELLASGMEPDRVRRALGRVTPRPPADDPRFATMKSPPRNLDICPDCDGAKTRASKRCQKCAVIAKREGRGRR